MVVVVVNQGKGSRLKKHHVHQCTVAASTTTVSAAAAVDAAAGVCTKSSQSMSCQCDQLARKS